MGETGERRAPLRPLYAPGGGVGSHNVRWILMQAPLPDPHLPEDPLIPEAPSHTFEGFSPEAFAALERLRQRPTVEHLREDRPAIDRHVVGPFRRYRDDLVVNWVLPNALPFETERGVFSRLPKNDFGAGGAHHHLWMAFYRPPLRRLADVQLSHGIYPDGFAWGLYVGAYAGDLFRVVREGMLEDEAGTLAVLNPLLAAGYAFSFAPRVVKREGDPTFTEPLAALPEGLASSSGIWVRRRVNREAVLALGPDLVAEALRAQRDLWPLYRRWAEALSGGGGE